MLTISPLNATRQPRAACAVEMRRSDRGVAEGKLVNAPFPCVFAVGRRHPGLAGRWPQTCFRCTGGACGQAYGAFQPELAVGRARTSASDDQLRAPKPRPRIQRSRPAGICRETRVRTCADASLLIGRTIGHWVESSQGFI